MINCFCSMLLNQQERPPRKYCYHLSVISNTLLMEINLSQIRTLDIKREKVCAVCPYLLFSFPPFSKIKGTVVHMRKKIKFFDFPKNGSNDFD